MTNEFLHRAIKTRVGPQKRQIEVLRRRKLAWFGHITRHKKPGQNGAAGNTRGRQKTRATGEVLGRQPEGVDQTGQPNPDEMDRGQACLAFAITQCVDHVSPTTTLFRD